MIQTKIVLWCVAALAAMLVLCCEQTSETVKSSGDSDADGDSDSDADSDADSDVDTSTNPADDNDNDGLSNGFEDELGTDPNNEDSDGDGVSDLIEWVAGTDPLDPESNPHAEGNFYFVVPYEDDPDPPDDTLVFSTELKKADLFILMDTTGSMGTAITNLQSDLSSIIIPEVAAVIPDIWFGVGRFDDYPVSTYGSAGDVPFTLLQRTTDDSALAQTAVDSLATNNGGDTPESHVPALWATATGGGLGTYLAEQTACDADEIGYPCFRDGAVPIIMLVTDAPFHNGPLNYQPYFGITPDPPTWDDALTALNEIHAKVTSIWVNYGWGGDVQAHCNQLAWDTGTEDSFGDPLVFDVDMWGTGLGSQVVEAIQLLASDVPFSSIDAEPRDDDTDAVDATLFIDHIEPNLEGGVEDPLNPGVFCIGGLETADDNDDTVPDKFVNVLPGTPVCFDIFPAMNTIVPETGDPQVFMSFIDVLGDAFTVLDTREVYFLVPPDSPLE
jgi:hypothetical protein